MSVKILQREGLVVPISGKVCDNCKTDYETSYASKPGEKIVIIMPKAQMPVIPQPLAVPSPFCSPPPPTAPTSPKPAKVQPPPAPKPTQEVMNSLSLMPVRTQSPEPLPPHVTSGHQPEQPVKRKRGRPKKVKEPEPEPAVTLQGNLGAVQK